MKLNKKYSNKYLRNVVCLFLILNSPFLILNAFSQNYPVQLTTQLSPPFSGYLNDYIAPDNEQLKALILFTDFTKPSYNVKLKFKLSGQGITIESKPFYFSGPVNLQPGIPLQLSGTELADLLNPNNLNFSGISLADYNQRKVLPEGFYEICFTAYDYNNPSNIQVSQQSCATAWMMLSDPPYLNLPACSTSVMVQAPQQVVFQWTPMNLASPNSAFNTEYEFSLYEVRPNGQNPNFIIQSLPPIYQVTTTQTTLLYGLTEPVLYTGMEYVWRVKAKDISGRDAFRNNGYSQICTFTYGNSLSNLDSSSITLNLQGQALTHRVMGLSWDSLNVFSSYKIEFKKAGSPNWYPMVTNNSRCTIGTLEPGQTYEARVKGVSTDGEGPWSNTVTVPLPNTPVIVCGQGGINPISQNVRLLKTANTYMIWEVGQFDMVVTQLNNYQSQSGQYSGMGKIEMPFLGINLNCTFNNITVTEMMQVINGEVNVVTQGINSWVASWEQMHDNTPDYNYNGVIDSIVVNPNGTITIYGSNGSVTQTPSTYPYTIVDANGTTYNVGSNGSVVTTNAVPHVELSTDQKDVYKLAMKLLKDENSNSKINQLTQELQQKDQNFNEYISELLNITFNNQTNLNYEDEIYFEPIGDDKELVGNETQMIEFSLKEIELFTAKVCNAFAKQNLNDAEYDLLANYLLIQSLKSHQYIQQELSNGTAKNNIAFEVKNALKVFIDEVLTKKVYTNK